MPEYTPTLQEKKAIKIMKAEATEFKDGEVWITDKASYKMLGSDGIIQKARKNYLGKYDRELDEVTNKKKIFIPMTEDMVETIVKNIDLDSADINIRATNPNGFSSALILRYILNYFMRRNYFGEILNELLRLFCIDGTVILKSLKNYDKKLGSQAIKSRIVDRTNFLIDPSADNIQDEAVIERNILKLSECKQYPWDNLEYLKGSTSIERLYGLERPLTTQVPYVEIFERWGDLPKYCLTGKEEDKEVWIPTIAIVSHLFDNPIVHKIVENKMGNKPYEECRFRKIFGRWDGRGIGEILLGLQSYINETVNLRLNKARISQIGLFKARKASGLTQQLLSSLVSGGVIPVNRMDDIQEMPLSDIKSSSYADEKNTYIWAQRTTGAWEVGRGETLPASLPATTAVLQQTGMRSGFDLLQENLGMFLGRVFERHIIPLLLETIKDEEVISIVGSPKELKEIDENYINTILNKNILESLIRTGHFPKPDFIDHLRGIYRDNLERFQKTRYFKINKKILTNWKYEVEVFVTGEAFNKAVMVRQLNDMLLSYSRLPGINIDVDAIFKEILDLMGLGGARFLKTPEEVQIRAPIVEAPRPAMVRPLEETEKVGEATTAERTGRGLAATLR